MARTHAASMAGLQQFFGTADFDTTRYVTQMVSALNNGMFKPGSISSGFGKHLQGRALLTPDEIMRLGLTRPIVLVSGEPPYLLGWLNYLRIERRPSRR